LPILARSNETARVDLTAAISRTLATYALRVPASNPTVAGFLYRECATHAATWLKKMAMARIDAAFVDECRLRYLISYLTTRWREQTAMVPASAR
jgi:hypothetical protein